MKLSIVVCTYNRADKIDNCLKSIEKLKYPKNKYEVIVVVDGSTDKTLDVVKKYDVKTVSIKKNKGIAFARNKGLEHAKGEIVVYLDDDCTVISDWLTEISKPFKNENVMGVAGNIIAFSKDTLMEKYLNNTGYGNPAPLSYGGNKRPLNRLFAYLSDMFDYSSEKKFRNFQEVHAIYSANSAYKVNLLKKVGGFDESLKSSEDTEVATRLKRNFPNYKFIFALKAVAKHKHERSILSFIRQTFYRSSSTFLYYRKEGKFPPIFPFPVLICLLLILSVMFLKLNTLLLIIFLPYLFYSWWLIRFIKTINFDYLLFPYIQLSIEMATILGIGKGLVYRKK